MTSKPNRSIHIRLLLFARYAEVVGVDSCDLSLAAPATVADAVAQLRASFPGAEALPENPLCARDHWQVAMDESVADGDELALLPPLAGG